MFGAILLFLLGAACFVLSIYFNNTLYFDGTPMDYVLFWGAIVLGIIFVIIAIDRLEREYGFLNSLLVKGQKKSTKAKNGNKTQKVKTKKVEDQQTHNEKNKKGNSKDPAWTLKSSGATSSFVLPLATLFTSSLIIAITAFVMSLLVKYEKFDGTIHWIAIVIGVIYYLIISVCSFGLDPDNVSLKSISPYHKTKKEVQNEISRALKKTGYAYYHLRVIRICLLAHIIHAAVACLITPYALNFLAATPIILFVSLINYKPETASDVVNDLISARVGDDWEKHLCQNCGAILGKNHPSDSHFLTGQSQSLGSETYNVTDEYTNGYDTLRVHRKEKEYYVKTKKSYHSEYSCPRCKYRWSEDTSYTSKDYI